MFVQGSGETPIKSDSSPMSFDLMSPQSGRDSNVSIKSELSDLESPEPGRGKMTHDKEQLTDNISVTERSTTTGTSRNHVTPLYAKHSPQFGTPKHGIRRVCTPNSAKFINLVKRFGTPNSAIFTSPVTCTPKSAKIPCTVNKLGTPNSTLFTSPVTSHCTPKSAQITSTVKKLGTPNSHKFTSTYNKLVTPKSAKGSPGYSKDKTPTRSKFGTAKRPKRFGTSYKPVKRINRVKHACSESTWQHTPVWNCAPSVFALSVEQLEVFSTFG